MGTDDFKNELVFSEEELSELEQSRRNRSSLNPDGRPRRKTHHKGLRVPADHVPRKSKPSEPIVLSDGLEPRKSSSRTLPLGVPVTPPPLPPGGGPPVAPAELPSEDTERMVTEELEERTELARVQRITPHDMPAVTPVQASPEPEEATTEPYLAPEQPLQSVASVEIPISVDEPVSEPGEREVTVPEQQAPKPEPPAADAAPSAESTATAPSPTPPQPPAGEEVASVIPPAPPEPPAPPAPTPAPQEAAPPEPAPPEPAPPGSPEPAPPEPSVAAEPASMESPEAPPAGETVSTAPPAPEPEAEPEPEPESGAAPQGEEVSSSADRAGDDAALADQPAEERAAADASAPAPPAGEEGAESPDDEEGDTVEIPQQVVQQAVHEAIKAASEAVAISAGGSASDTAFDLEDTTMPGASEALEELSARHTPRTAVDAEGEEEEEGERANRVAILLGALQSPAKKRAAAAPGPAASEVPDTDAPPAEQPGSPETTTEGAPVEGPAEEPQVSAPGPSVEPVSPFPLAEDLVQAPAEPAEAGAPPSSPAAAETPAAAASPVAVETIPAAPLRTRTDTGELEELSGEDLEELESEREGEAEGTAPPPIPEPPPLSPFDQEGGPEPEVVRVPVRGDAPQDEEAVMTSAMPDDDGQPGAQDPARAPTAPMAPVSPPRPPAAAQATPAAAPPPAVPPPPTPTPTPATVETSPRAAVSRGRKRKKAWFEEIFDEDWLRTLKPLDPSHVAKQVDFLEESLQPSPDSELLDLGCGDGRHTIELAGRGYKVTGYDLSLPLLIRAADEAQRRSLQVNFVHGDFRELSFNEQFDAVYCLNTSFGYFDDDSNRKMVHAVTEALRVGGRFLLEVVNRDYVVRDLPARIWWEGEGSVILEEVDFNYFTSRIVSKRSVVFEDGRHLEQEFSVRSYSLHELGKILHHAGFRVLEVSGHIAHRARFFGSNSRTLVLLAEKRSS